MNPNPSSPIFSMGHFTLTSRVEHFSRLIPSELLYVHILMRHISMSRHGACHYALPEICDVYERYVSAPVSAHPTYL
eukprot:scaffold45584_cov40-Tisochrysis_lutea.AAC.2